ncbi:MAG: peptidoglycan-associated lipoprotein Pal [Burkholderiales bacterium]|nr:peptidoglycan-associated lipoprotein Pal [Burkholderiales bacterium]
MRFALRTPSTIRWHAAGLCVAAAALLAGCGSSVKLDEAPPVEDAKPRTIDPTAGTGAAQPRTGSLPETTVKPVDLGKSGGATAAGLSRVVYFDFDSFVVKEDFRPMIEAHAKALAANKSKRMRVEGHTDERGGREYNLALGQKRAEAVAKSLALLGAGDAQIEAVSFGKEQPVADGHDEAAWAKNRRAELKDR